MNTPDALSAVDPTIDPETVAAVRAEVLDAARTMYERGLVEGTAGNVSGRISPELVVVTPSSLSYRAMTIDDLVVVDLDGATVAGERSPTSEKSLHLECYRRYPEVQGVVHCHARYSSMFAVSGRSIPAGIDEFVIYIGGDVRCAPYQQSGTDGLAHAVAAELADRSAALMANHGLVCVGKSVDDALHSALVVEHNAQIMWGAEDLGGVVPLPDSAVRDFTNIYAYVRGETWPRP